MERGLGKLQSVEEEGIPSYSGITFSNPSVRLCACLRLRSCGYGGGWDGDTREEAPKIPFVWPCLA